MITDMKRWLIALLPIIILSTSLIIYDQIQTAEAQAQAEATFSAKLQKAIIDNSYPEIYTPQTKNNMIIQIEREGCFILDDTGSTFNVSCDPNIEIRISIENLEARITALENRK